MCIILLKLVVLISCRSATYAGFYRKRPALANITALALECANLALSIGFVLLRIIKLLLTAALYVGRIDTPFLAPGVGQLGGFELDNYPRIFVKDVLAQEAHRHPYIETLGVMYLMKLRYGDHFGKRAGSAWRLVFVYALMPWLNTYRINGRAAEPVLYSTNHEMEFLSLRHSFHLESFDLGNASSERPEDDNSDDTPHQDNKGGQDASKPISFRSPDASKPVSFRSQDGIKPVSLPGRSSYLRHASAGLSRRTLGCGRDLDLQKEVLKLQAEVERLENLLKERQEAKEAIEVQLP